MENNKQSNQEDSVTEANQMMNNPENDAPAGLETDEQTDNPAALYDLDVPNASPPQ